MNRTKCATVQRHHPTLAQGKDARPDSYWSAFGHDSSLGRCRASLQHRCALVACSCREPGYVTFQQEYRSGVASCRKAVHHAEFVSVSPLVILRLVASMGFDINEPLRLCGFSAYTVRPFQSRSFSSFQLDSMVQMA